jgi:hypothetical protein
VVGTCQSGYNATVDGFCNLLSGKQVEVDQPSDLAVRSDDAILFDDTGNNNRKHIHAGLRHRGGPGRSARHHRLPATERVLSSRIDPRALVCDRP